MGYLKLTSSMQLVVFLILIPLTLEQAKAAILWRR